MITDKSSDGDENDGDDAIGNADAGDSNASGCSKNNKDASADYIENFAKMQANFFKNMTPIMEQFSSNSMQKSLLNMVEHSKRMEWQAWPVPMTNAMMDNGTENIAKLCEGWAKIMADGFGQSSPKNKDKRFVHAAWEGNPLYAYLQQQYLFLCAQADAWLESQDNISEPEKEQLKFQFAQFFDAASPSNFIFSNPEIIEKAIETNGKSLQKGLQNAINDMSKGQLTHTDPNAFELGVNIAMTPGKIVHETPLYQLIQYDPMTKDQLATPLVIFPPWINRYYILDLNPQKSFVKWALEQGITVFMVSWKSADSSMATIMWDDYVKAEIEAIDTIRDGLDVDSVHAIGYCVAGTTLNAALAILHTRGDQDKVKSATFFTTQVDFEDSGDLRIFTTDAHVKLLDAASSQGYLDGRVMAATFNMLRSKDLIWNYVVNNYLLGNDYPAFDLLHWNGDTTNLPAAWHKSYINDLYRHNLLVIPNRLSVDGTPIDLRRIKTPAYIQAGIEDHIAPAKSVWKLRNHLSGPVRFTLAGSGHIAGVVNHPDAQKYQYWRNDSDDLASLDEFIAGARETKGSWWPDWLDWLREQDSRTVPAKGARIAGEGVLPALEDAPGRYVRMR